MISARDVSLSMAQPSVSSIDKLLQAVAYGFSDAGSTPNMP